MLMPLKNLQIVLVVAGDYNDLENKPTIPNIAVVNLEMEDIDTSATPFTITNQDKISQICDLLDAKTCVIGLFAFDPVPAPVLYTFITANTGTDLTNVTLVATGIAFTQGYSGQMIGVAVADVTSRYVTSNTEP